MSNTTEKVCPCCGTPRPKITLKLEDELYTVFAECYKCGADYCVSVAPESGIGLDDCVRKLYTEWDKFVSEEKNLFYTIESLWQAVPQVLKRVRRDIGVRSAQDYTRIKQNSLRMQAIKLIVETTDMPHSQIVAHGFAELPMAASRPGKDACDVEKMMYAVALLLAELERGATLGCLNADYVYDLFPFSRPVPQPATADSKVAEARRFVLASQVWLSRLCSFFVKKQDKED